MDTDLRLSATWRQVTEFFSLMHSPAEGRPSDFSGVAGRPGSDEVVATATVCDSLDVPPRRVVVRIRDGELTQVSDGKAKTIRGYYP